MIFLGKKKSENMVVNVTRISQKIKNKLIEYKKKYYKIKKNALLQEKVSGFFYFEALQVPS